MKRLAIIALSTSLMISTQAWAGPGHGEDAFASAAPSTSLTLPQETINNLKIQALIVELAPVQDTVKLVAQMKLLPEKQALISARSQGRITDIRVKLGEEISKGQALMSFEPITVGSGTIILNAPMAGVLTQQNVVVGQMFNAGDALMEVADRSKMLAKGLTYESVDLGKIRINQNATLTVDSLPRKTFSGIVQRIDPSLDEKDRTFAIYVLVENPEATLLPHLQGDLEIAIGNPEEILAVPERAILGTIGNHFIYVKDGMNFEKRIVELGIRKGGKREIISGIFPDEEVVVQGNYQLQYITPEGAAKPQDDHGHQH